jgi:uncharacterized protein (TIGR03083 family)
VREHIAELATSSPDVADLVIPSCPEWTVIDLVEHLAGNCASMTGERAAGSGLDGLLEGWRASAERLTGDPDVSRLLMDAFTHELDVREALSVPAPADHPAYPLAFEVVVGGLSWSISSRGLPALRLACDGESWVAGSGAPAATVTASRYDLYRSLSGRRTPAQIATLTWTDDPTRWVPAFFWGPFSPPG